MARDELRVWYQSFTDPDADRAYFDRLAAFVNDAASAGTTVDVHGIRPGDHDLHPITELRGSLTTLRAAIRAQEEGYDAVVIGHFQEPGLGIVRSVCDLPVIGLGEATMLHACTLGRKIGLVTINPVFIPYHWDQITAAGLRERVVDVRAVTAQVADYVRAFEDETARAAMFENFVRQVEPMVDDGVEVIIPAGGLPMLLFGRGTRLTVKGAAVLNGLPVAVAAAETAVRLRRRYGVEPSRSGLLAKPSEKALRQLLDTLTPDTGLI